MSERLKRALGRIPVHIVVITIAILWFIPTIGLLISSFRPPQDIASSGWWEVFTPPTDFTLELYEEAITARNMGQSFVNSLFITIPATIIPIMAAAFAAYAFAWLEFPGRNVLFLVVVALLAVPLQMTFIPILQIYNRAGLTGEFLGIWLAHAGFGMPFSVYLLRNSVGALPKDLFESAYLDGATSFDIFFRIVMPLVVPSIASLVIFQFLWVWNDLLVALIFLGGHPAVAPLTVTIGNLVNSLGGNWQVLTAAAFISMILPLLVFFSLQRYFVRGILAGSVKG
ncbi:MAG: carbohydrate ABC transporter permease [Anaerolineae bacterium]|jgi:alpha-glucoside transport system permease protein|nr:carbohydrate ABC transporter permease [Anaerolineae bacterium]MDX9830252.1 carbohydrate ABC transporter permease [Anaerolineae bacterium]